MSPHVSIVAVDVVMDAGGSRPLRAGSRHDYFIPTSDEGLLYLVTLGSVVAYTAYVWLLDNAPLGTVATYAYVNPIVAIALGAFVLHESLTWTIGIGAALVLACVALVVRKEREVAAAIPTEPPQPANSPSTQLETEVAGWS